MPRATSIDLAPRLSELGIARELYPFQGRELRIRDRSGRGDLRLSYLDEGPEDAPVVVMVHGNPTWSFFYRELVLRLRATHRCIVPDHIGMGLSDKPGDDRYDYTLASRVADLTTLLDHVAPTGPVSLVVHDWGGMIGTAWAVDHADRVDKMVVMNTAAFPLPKSKRFPAPLALTRTPLGALLVRGGNAFSRTASRVCVKKGALPREVRKAYTAPYRSWADRIATLRFVEDIPLKTTDRAYRVVSDTEGKLSRLADKRMLLAFGLEDFVFDRHFLADWERHFPKAEVMRFEDAGHYVLEDERETLLPKIAAFLG
jgi:haloalkane dehalogenase